MRVITDFHLHSTYSRACSKQLTVPNIAKACERKGIQFVGTADFTHPAWRKEIGSELEEKGNGVLRLRDGTSSTAFLLATELSCIYKRGGKTRRVHLLVLLSSLDAVDRFTDALVQRGCNVKSDGRPILGMDAEELLKIMLDADPKGLMIPAHAWTPWFSVFGSQSGFDSLEECFGEMAKYIPAVETGLSSDPAMNWRLSQLDHLFLVSNSDAHSLDKLGREANVFEMDYPSYDELHRIFVERDRTKFLETIEFFPEEGKYHADGHRDCHFWCDPAETKKRKGLCPKCGKPLTIGVLHRVETLADRGAGFCPPQAVPFRSIIPLAELVSQAMDVGKTSRVFKLEMERILADQRTEFGILLDLPIEEIARVSKREIAEAIRQMREGRVKIRPGFDGEFGIVEVAEAHPRRPKQEILF